MEAQELKEKAEKLGVSVEVYILLRKSNRKMRYFARDLKQDRIVIDGEKITFIPSREISYDQLLEDGFAFASEEKSVEAITVDNSVLKRLRDSLDLLDEGERRLIDEIYFSHGGDGKSEREAAESLGIPNMTLHDRKIKVLAKLKKLLEL